MANWSAGLLVMLGAATLYLVPTLLLAAIPLMLLRRQPASVCAGARSGAQSHVRPAESIVAAQPVGAAQLSMLVPDVLSTQQLCLAWRISYWTLRSTADLTTRAQIISVRANLLNELERRDRPGFVRWLDSGASACGNPHRHLATRR